MPDTDRPDRLNPYITRRACAYLALNSLAWAAVLGGFLAASRYRIGLAIGLFWAGAVAAWVATRWKEDFETWAWWPGPGESKAKAKGD